MRIPFEIKERFNVLANDNSIIGCGYEPLGGAIRIDDTDPRIKYSGTGWAGSSAASTEGLNNHRMGTGVIGDSLSFSFIGTGVTGGLFKAHNQGIIAVSIDDGAETQIDLYQAITGINAWAYPTLVTLATGLAYGYHTINVRLAGCNPASSVCLNVHYFDIITTTDSTIKLSRDGIQNRSSALTLGSLCESTADITQNIAEITQLVKNASFKRMSPTWGIVFQDPFTRADGAAGNGWEQSSGTAWIVTNRLSLTNVYAYNGSLDWGDRVFTYKMTSFVTSRCIVKVVNGNNYISAHIAVGSSNNISMETNINGVYTSGNDPKTLTLVQGDTIYVKGESKGALYSVTVSKNADFSGGVTTTVYTAGLPKGRIGVSANDAVTTAYVDDVVVTGPVPYGWSATPAIGVVKSVNDNVVKSVNNLDVTSACDMSTTDVYIPVAAGATYTLKMDRKLSAYTSGSGARILIRFFQSDKTTQVGSDIVSSLVTSVDADFATVTLSSGVVPANAAYAYVDGRFTGIGTCEWKEPLFELTSTARGVFHEKESKMSLSWLKNDGTTGVTEGTGEDEVAYKVTAMDGSITDFQRDKCTVPHWDRLKSWQGGTGWYRLSTYLASQITDDTYYISFVGTGISVNIAASNESGIVGLTIDGGTEILKDMYNSGGTYIEKLCFKGLPYGQHQLKIRVTGAKTLASVAYVYVHSFEIYGPKIPDTPADCQRLGAVLKADPDDGWIRYDTNEGILYNGASWAASTVSTFYNGTWKITNGLNEYAEFAFVGTGVRYVTCMGPNSGISEVFTDEGAGYASRGTIDGYSASQVGQLAKYTKTDLTLGLYKIKIVCTHTKNASSSEYYVGIDAFDVKQTQYVIDLRQKEVQGTKDYVDKLVGDMGLLGKISTLVEGIKDANPKFYISSFNRDISLTGKQVVSGLPGKPKAVIFISAILGLAGAMSIGIDAIGSAYMLVDYHSVTANSYSAGTAGSICIYSSGSANSYASICAVGDNSFTLNWSKNGSPAGTANIGYWVIY